MEECFVHFPFFILRHGSKRPAVQPQTIYSEIPKKKRLLPQHSVCDKSLKRTHGIGHSCRDDAAMQQPSARNAGRLPFTPLHQGEYIKLQRNCKAFFWGRGRFFTACGYSARSHSVWGRERNSSFWARKSELRALILPRPCTSGSIKRFFEGTQRQAPPAPGWGWA